MQLQLPLTLPGLLALAIGSLGILAAFVARAEHYGRRMAGASLLTCVWGYLLYAYANTTLLEQAHIFSSLLFIFACLIPTVWFVYLVYPYISSIAFNWKFWFIFPFIPYLFVLVFLPLPNVLSSLILSVDGFEAFYNGQMLARITIGPIGAALLGYGILSSLGVLAAVIWRLLQLPRSYISTIGWVLILPVVVILTIAFLTVGGIVTLSLYTVSVFELVLHIILLALAMITRVFSIKPIPRHVVFQEMHDAALIYEANGNIVSSNHSADELFVRGQTLEQRLAGFEHIYTLAQKCEPLERIVEVEKPGGGSTLWWQVRIRPIKSDTPRSLGWTLLVSDITLEYRAANDLQLNLAQLQGLIAETRDGVAFVESSGRIILWNTSLSQLTGISAEEALNHSILDVHPVLYNLMGYDAPSTEHLFMNGTGGGYTQNLRLGPNDEYECRGSVFPIRVSQDYVLLGLLCRDMTEIREAERQREQTIAELEERLAEVHNLSGLLPVCGWCGKVRSDTGYWEKLDLYLADHAGAQVSHGICPSCARNLELDSRQSRIKGDV